jgi:hypothetical protein
MWSVLLKQCKLKNVCKIHNNTWPSTTVNGWNTSERLSRVVNTPASYAGRPRFKSWPRDRHSWLRAFQVFISHYRQSIVPQATTTSFRNLSNSFIIHISSFHSTRNSLSYWESVIKLQRVVKTPNYLKYYNVLDCWTSRGSSVSIVSDYGLDDRVIRGSVPDRGKGFASSLCFQTSSGAHSAYCPMGVPWVRSPGVKRGRGVTLTTPHLFPRSWMSRSYTSSSPCASIGVLWDWFTFTY